MPHKRNSESKLAIDTCAPNRPLTAFHTVNAGTELEALDLNWTERDLPERLRTKHVHRLHPYLGKYVPQLVEIFLRKFSPTRVFDPFAGSGTTLVEANSLGVESYGSDISAFNCLLSRVKTSKYDLRKVSYEALDALERTRIAVDSIAEQANLFVGVAGRLSDFEESAYLKSWFAPSALRALLAYRSITEGYEYSDLLRVILSRAARSSRLTRHFDLDFPKTPQSEPYYCHKHDRTCMPTSDAMGFLKRYTLDTVKRIAEFAEIRTSAKVHIFNEDARFVKIPKIDLVMTSPPYIGLIDYHEQHRYAYELLGLPRRDESEIGAAFKGKSKGAHETFIGQIADVFENARRSLKRGGHVVIVVGDRENLYDGLAARIGFREKQRLKRHVNRRTGRRSTEFFEDVLIWEAK